jgi:integrase/recombinase XerD
MLAWQARAEAQLLDDLPSVPREGTIAGDVPKFLAMIPAGRTREDFADLLQHWIACPLGSVHRHDLSREAIIGQRSRWVEAGAAAVTVNHRLRALRALYNGLDGPTVPHPTDKIPNVKGPARTPRGIPMDVVEKILAEIPDRGRGERHGTRADVSFTKIRLSVIAWTGIPPVQLERLQARHLDLSQCVDRRGARVYLQPRRKAKGSPGAWVKLLPQAVEAFEQFAAANLWGKPFSRSSMGKSWKGAIRRITERLSADYKRTKDRTALDAWLHAIPPHCRPYDLRHSFGTEAYRITGDLRAVAELLQHADLETTKQYTGAAVSERVSSAIDKMEAAHTAAKRPRLVK